MDSSDGIIGNDPTKNPALRWADEGKLNLHNNLINRL